MVFLWLLQGQLVHAHLQTRLYYLLRELHFLLPIPRRNISRNHLYCVMGGVFLKDILLMMLLLKRHREKLLSLKGQTMLFYLACIQNFQQAGYLDLPPLSKKL